MDIVGSRFGDEFFDEPKSKKWKQPSNYVAKSFTQHWFMEVDMKGKEESELLAIIKHQADYFYSTGNFSKAADAYQQCLKYVPSSNITFIRQFTENIARSFLHIEDYDKALEWGLKLDMCSSSSDQKVVSMNLLAVICHKLGKYQEELEALHSCMEAHKTSPEFWYRLGLCYAGLFSIHLPGHSILKPSVKLEEEPCCPFRRKIDSTLHLETSSESPNVKENSKVLNISPMGKEECSSTSYKCDTCTLTTQVISSCLIHTKMLLKSGTNLLNPEKDELLKDDISKCLTHMEIEPLFVEVASKMLGSNFLNPLDVCANLQSGESCVKEKDNLTLTD